jgi:hypothetical protein
MPQLSMIHSQSAVVALAYAADQAVLLGSTGEHLVSGLRELRAPLSDFSADVFAISVAWIASM